MSTKEKRAIEVYRKTRSLANKNAIAQGFSGAFGLGVNLAVDIAALPFYAGLWNDIRNIYGKGTITLPAAKAYLRPNLGFLAQDLLWDKMVGSVPVVGIPFNVAFAKALTWRLGAWFGILSALGEEIGAEEMLVRSTMQLTREIFPSNGDVFTFKTPHQVTFVAFIAAQDGLNAQEAQRRTQAALNVLTGIEEFLKTAS